MGKWVKKKLGEVIIDSYAGGTPNRNREDFFGGEIPWVTSGEVNNPEIISTMENITEAGIKGSSAKWIPENSILVALYGATAGQVSMLKIKATSNQAVLAIIPNNEIIDTDFLHNQICFNKQNLLFLAQGSGQPNLSKNIVDRLPISYPSSLFEQRRIASILSSADKVIDSTQKLIAKYKQIKQGMMEDLLKPKEGWKKVKLGECCTRLCNGMTYDIEEKEGYMVTRIETISDGVIDLAKIGHTSIMPKIEYKLQKGDILFSHINSLKHIGKIAYCNGDVELYHGMNLLVIRVNENIDSKYLYYQLSFDDVRTQIRTLAKSAVNQASINTTELQKFEINIPISCSDIPDLSEQCRIASILSGIDKKIESEEKVLEKYKKIKKGLMEKLLNCE